MKNYTEQANYLIQHNGKCKKVLCYDCLVPCKTPRVTICTPEYAKKIAEEYLQKLSEYYYNRI